MELGDLNKVWEIRVMKSKPRQDEARKILESISMQVQPILRRRKWRVKLLSEFWCYDGPSPNSLHHEIVYLYMLQRCCSQKNLLGLNVNHGANVRLRLRQWNREWEFFPFEKILDTMLHELAHIECGPHNATFYQLWDELREECTELMAKGVTGTGQGFDLPGRRLGGFSRQPPLSSLNQNTLAAAEKRQRLHSLLPVSKRLGGDKGLMSALTPVQAAAMAAERRLQDDIWCQSWSNELFIDEETGPDNSTKGSTGGEKATSSNIMNDYKSQSSNENSRKRTRISEEGLSAGSRECSGTNFIDLTADSELGAASCSHSIDGGPRLNAVNVTAGDFTSGTVHGDEQKNGAWECETCTLLNPPLALVCEVCNSSKPKDASMKYKFWSCKFCTLENSVTLDNCSACGQWRYSHGSPVSTRSHILGT